MKITYREVNGYLIPNLKLPPEEANFRLGKWGMMYKDYLQKNKKVFFNTLLIQANCISTAPKLKSRQMKCLI